MKFFLKCDVTCTLTPVSLSQGAVHKVRHAIFGPLSHFVTHPGTPSPESTSHISDPPPIFRRPRLVQKTRTKATLYKFSLNCSRGFLSGGFVRWSFVWNVLSGVVFCPLPFCQNNLLHQKVKHHFKFHVSYV